MTPEPKFLFFGSAAAIAFFVSWYLADNGNGPFPKHLFRLFLAIAASGMAVFVLVLLAALFEASWTGDREGLAWSGFVAVMLSAIWFPASVMGFFLGVLAKGGLK